MKALKIIIAVFFIMISTVFAGDAGQETPFSIGAGARALGMGGGFISLADDASAIYYNPAGLPNLNYQEFSFMHIELFEGTSYNYAGWVFPDSKLRGVGIGFFRIGTDDIEGRSDFISGSTFGYSESQILFSYGQTLGDDFSIGGSFKIVNQSLDTLSDYGLGFDVGFSLQLTDNISSGLIFRDIVPSELKLAAETETAPITIAGGIGLKNISLREKSTLTAAIELEKIENRTIKVHTGGELLFNQIYALRTGYDKDNFSFGAGIIINRIKIDYAYKIMDNINDSHRFSLSFLIGTSVKDKLLKEKKLAESRGTTLLAEERLKQFEFYKQKADTYNNSFQLDSALVYYQRALAFDEHNEEIIGVIAAIENSINIQVKTEQQYKQHHQEIETARVTYLAQAQSFYEKHYYNAALDMLQLSLDVSPDYSEALNLKSRIENDIKNELRKNFSDAVEAEKSGNNIEAVIAYNKIIEIDPENKKALEAIAHIAENINIAQQLNSGIQLYNNKRIRSAKKTFEAVLLLDNENPVAIEYLKKISASSIKETTLDDLHSNKKIWGLYLDGLKYMRDNQYQKAIDVWKLVLKEYPNNINTINNIEQAKLRLSSEKSN